jgi:hypothetical protein
MNGTENSLKGLFKPPSLIFWLLSCKSPPLFSTPAPARVIDGFSFAKVVAKERVLQQTFATEKIEQIADLLMICKS